MAKYIDVESLVVGYSGHTPDDEFSKGVDFVLDLLDSKHPADVKPVVRGRWVRHYCDEDGKYDGWGCDKCKEWYFFGPSKPNFCPNCGADMREGGADGDEE